MANKAGISALVLRGLFLFLLAGLVGGCDEKEKKPSYYYLMDFAAVVEGESFEFKTRVECRPTKTAGEPFRKKTYKDLTERISFGKKLASGGGVFVAVPHWCEYIGDSDGLTVPLIYITDNYENPQHLRGFVNPHGPLPGSGIELKKSVIRKLREGDNASAIPVLPKDSHDPFAEYDVHKVAWDVIGTLPAKTDYLPPPGQRIFTSKNGRWDLYDSPESGPIIRPEYADGVGTYWMGRVPSIKPLNFDPLDHKNQGQHSIDSFKLAGWSYPRSMRIFLDGDVLRLDSDTHGVVDAYPSPNQVWSAKTFMIAIDEDVVEVKGQSLRDRHLFLYDRKTQLLHKIYFSYFRA